MEAKPNPNSEQRHLSMQSQKKGFAWFFHYYPIRYYATAFLVALVLLEFQYVLKDAVGRLSVFILGFFHTYSYFLDGTIYVGNFYHVASVDTPLSVQTVFVMFFLTVVATVRTSVDKRLKLFFYGIVCFLAQVFVGSLLILALSDLAHKELFMIMGWAQAVVGSIITVLAIFSVLTIPTRRKVKRTVKRSYMREYAYLIVVLLLSAMTVFVISDFIGVQQDQPGIPIVLGGSLALIFYGNVLATFVSETSVPTWAKNRPSEQYPTVSFLIPAYNEQENIRNCLESIELAASRYKGKTEIILVNDGSTDNTQSIAEATFRNFRYCSGEILNLKNCGKGAALRSGLERTTAEIICRMDADSVIDKNAMIPFVAHFRDPAVGSVSGLVLTQDSNNFWVRTANLWHLFNIWRKKSQDVLDSIIVQAGAFSVFRRKALVEVGGWTDNIFGEDGDLTSRLSRAGYRNRFEIKAIMHSDAPSTLAGVLQQRSRWGVAYYHSRGINMGQVTEFATPRSLVFLSNLIQHGGGFVASMFFPYLIASLIVAGAYPNLQNPLPQIISLLVKLIEIRLFIFVIEIASFAYYLKKLGRGLSDLKYFFPLQIFNLILMVLINPQVIGVLLPWSSKWKEYNRKSFEDLRKEVKRSIDPNYTSGETKR